jgi:hypothetical protein
MQQIGSGRRLRRALSVALLATLAPVAACRMTPEEIRVIRTENELLREQNQALRERCVQERQLELRPGEPGDRRSAPAPPP